MYEIRQSIGGWSIDKLINGHWTFYIKLSSKRKCIEYIRIKTNPTNTAQSTLNL